MSYVGAPFRHDIFMSYSHGSDGQGKAYLQKWSESFAIALEAEFGVDPRFHGLKLFRDLDHRPTQGVDPLAPLTDQLKEEVAASALLMVLMSPHYLESKWCAQERAWWEGNQFEAGLATPQKIPVGLSAKERVAIVKIWDTEQQEWPPLFVDSAGEKTTGFQFWRAVAGQPRPLGWKRAGEDFDEVVTEEILSIVGRVGARLEEMKRRIGEKERARAEAQKLQDAGQAVYLHARSQHKDAWDKAASELIGSGFAVFGNPEEVGGAPVHLQASRESRVQQLCDCDALLLLGTADTRSLDADMLMVGKQDRQLARSRSNKLLPCGLIDTVGPALATPVRLGNAKILQTRWLHATTPEWPSEVGPWLAGQGVQLEQRT